MPKIPKNYIIIAIIFSITSLIMGGTFFAISQNKSGQNLVSNSTQNSAQSSFISQSSSSLFSSISSSQSSQSQKAFSSQQTISNSNSISQSSLINSQGSTSLKKDSISVEDRKFWYTQSQLKVDKINKTTRTFYLYYYVSLWSRCKSWYGFGYIKN